MSVIGGDPVLLYGLNSAGEAVPLLLNADGTLSGGGSGSVSNHTHEDAITQGGVLTAYGLDYGACQGRLTLTTAVPITTADVTGATTLYFTPYKGAQIGTYNGTAWGVSVFTEKSLSLAGLTANSNYDIFIVDGTLALEALIWTNGTTRATALTTQNGVLVKSGDATRRYLGTIRILATGQTEDSVAHRFVWNYYNRVLRSMSVVDATDSWTYNSATWRQARAQATNQVDYVCGVSEDLVRADVLVTNIAIQTTYAVVGVGVDSTTDNSARINNKTFAGNNQGGLDTTSRIPCSAAYKGWPGVGYHYLAWLESSPSGTSTFEGDGGDAWMQSGLVAEVVA